MLICRLTACLEPIVKRRKPYQSRLCKVFVLFFSQRCCWSVAPTVENSNLLLQDLRDLQPLLGITG